MNIGLDIDDVIHDFVGELVTHLNKETGKNLIKEDINLWIMDSVYGLNQSEFKEIVKNSGLYIHNDINKETLNIINKIKEDGHNLYLITSRYTFEDFDTIQYTKEWLEKFDIIYDKLIFSYDKGESCKEHEIDFFLDDCISNVLKIKEKSNTIAILYNQPWNGIEEQNRLNVYFDEIKRVNNLNEFYQIIGNKKEL